MKSKPRNENTGEPKPKIPKDSTSEDEATQQKPLKDPSQDLFKTSSQTPLDTATNISFEDTEDDTEMMNLGNRLIQDPPTTSRSTDSPIEPIRTPTPPCFRDNMMSYSNAVGAAQPSPSPTPTTRYKNNVSRTLTIWPREDCTATQIIHSVGRSLDMNPKDCLVGVERDTRVKSKNKFNLVFTSDQALEAVKYRGVCINGVTYHPRVPRERPPPRKRCFLPNFPVAASPELLMAAAEYNGLTPIQATPRTERATSVRIGGWILWVEPASTEPELLSFAPTARTQSHTQRDGNHKC